MKEISEAKAVLEKHGLLDSIFSNKEACEFTNVQPRKANTAIPESKKRNERLESISKTSK
jgi:hypothetical protein